MAWKYNIGQRVIMTCRAWVGRKGIITNREVGNYRVQFDDGFSLWFTVRDFIPLNNIPQNVVEYDETWI